MVSPTQSTAFRRLLRLAVTVMLNLALVLTSVSWILSQSTRIEFAVSTPLGVVALDIDQQGWRWLLESIYLAGEVSFNLREQHFEEWRLPPSGGEDMLQSFCGVYWANYEGLGYRFFYYKHWFVLSALAFLQAIHHRRFITRLIRRLV